MSDSWFLHRLGSLFSPLFFPTFIFGGHSASLGIPKTSPGLLAGWEELGTPCVAEPTAVRVYNNRIQSRTHRGRKHWGLVQRKPGTRVPSVSSHEVVWDSVHLAVPCANMWKCCRPRKRIRDLSGEFLEPGHRGSPPNVRAFQTPGGKQAFSTKLAVGSSSVREWREPS